MSIQKTIAWGVCALVIVLSGAWPSRAQAKAPYPNMAPLDQYLMQDRNAEIVLARSAAPPTISGDATVLVLGRHGYETAAEGKNGFVCVVQRSWTADFDDPVFWNPKLRGPICLNPPAVKSFLPIISKRTEMVLAGLSKEQMIEEIKAALSKKQLPTVEPGAMSYMMSKEGYLNDRAGHWLPHLMFFAPSTAPGAWGANVDGSPVLAFKDSPEGVTIFLVPVGQWSDGTAAPKM